MTTFMDPAGVQRLAAYFSEIGDLLGRERRRASFAIYAMGLLGDGERKSNEPMATRGCADPKAADAAHQRLLHFISDSKWDDHAVRKCAAEYALTEMTKRSPVEAILVP